MVSIQMQLSASERTEGKEIFDHPGDLIGGSYGDSLSFLGRTRDGLWAMEENRGIARFNLVVLHDEA